MPKNESFCKKVFISIKSTKASLEEYLSGNHLHKIRKIHNTLTNQPCEGKKHTCLKELLPRNFGSVSNALETVPLQHEQRVKLVPHSEM